MFGFLRNLLRPSASSRKKLLPESEYVVQLTNEEIINNRPDGSIKHLRLDAISGVSIITNDTGPWGADVWYLLLGPDEHSDLSFPQGATGEQAILDYLFKLPGFDHQSFLDAMSCVENKRFMCWSRAA